MNGNNGIVPTVDLATNNNNGYAYPYPVYPMMSGYGNNGFGFGGDGIWGLLALALIFGNNGWGGFGGMNGGIGIADGGLLGYAIGNNATKSDLSDGLTSVQNSSKLDSISTQISNGFADAATNLCNVRSDILTGNMGLQNSILDSKYADAINSGNVIREIVSQTNELNTNLLTTQLNAQAQLDKCCCDIKELIRADGDETRALITQNTIQDLRDRLTAAQDVISDQRTESNIINSLSPRPTPSYIVSSPYQSIFPYGYGFGNGFWGNNGFYGNGFYGNTII